VNQKVRIIKRGDRKEPELDRLEEPSHHPTREITTTINLWISEFKERRRTDQDPTKTGNKLVLTALR